MYKLCSQHKVWGCRSCSFITTYKAPIFISIKILAEDHVE